MTDRYGAGGVVAQLEAETAAILGKEAALFFPTGTMAQQVALRLHADDRGCSQVAFHPACHLLHREEMGFERLHGLQGRSVGDINRLLRVADLAELDGPLGVLLLEVPQRDIGGQLPSLAELNDSVQWAHGVGAAAHLDGARLWEACAAYERTPAEVAAPFDSVYVSFYKGLGGIAGCCLAGSAEFIESAALWRVRHGGRVVAMWPYAASGLSALHLRLGRMQSYLAHATAIARELQGIPGIEILPSPPQTSMMHLFLPLTPAGLKAGALRVARDEGIWAWPEPFPSPIREPEGRVRVEFVVGDATLKLTPAEVRRTIEGILAA